METQKTLYVSDLDGTLLTKYETVSPYSAQLLNDLMERGLLFTFATARSVVSAKSATSALGIRTPVILYNGGLVYNLSTREVLRAVLFTPEEKGYILTVLEEYGIVPFVFGATNERETLRWIDGRESYGMKRYLDRRRSDARLCQAANEGELLEGNVFYFKCIGPREQLERAWNDLKLDTRFICIFHQETYQNDFWMEISPREATKANAVSFLRNRLACDKVVCFGDTSNDSDMFDVCDEKFAVMNADGWLKEKATGVIGYCEEDGVAKFLAERFR